jgi:pimeloyl-ACP methyl ester carboxylesterase
VWTGLRHVLEQRSVGLWLAPDLSGHGGSDPLPHYSVGHLAAELAGAVRQHSDVYVIGHSLGVYVGLALASGWFGVDVRGVVGLGPKISWPQTDVQSAREIATRPVRWYATSEEAWARYRRVSGLDARIAPAEEWLQRGVIQGPEAWRLSQDPRTFAVAGAPFSTLVTSARGRILLARGEHDPMVSMDELRQHARHTAEIAQAGHNAHVERPDELVRLLERLIADG